MTTSSIMKQSRIQILQTHLPMPSLQKSKSISAVMVMVVGAAMVVTVIMATVAMAMAVGDTKSPRTGGQVSSRTMARKV